MNPGVVELLANPYAYRLWAAILGATLVFFAVVSIILLYHWKRYEPVNSKIFFAIVIYFGVSAFLFCGAIYFLFLLFIK